VKTRVIDFEAARMRAEALAADVHEIELPASRIPVPKGDVVEVELTPSATLLERARATLGEAGLAELLHTTLEESK
jgi:hypothetical protein